VKPEDVTLLSGELQQFKRLQNERGRTDHDIWMTIPDQEIVENNIDDAQIAQRGLQMLMDEGSEAKLKSRVIELEDELQRVYGAYGDLKDIHQKLWGKYVDEKMQQE
jgi:glutathionylspermidine synthase